MFLFSQNCVLLWITGKYIRIVQNINCQVHKDKPFLGSLEWDRHCRRSTSLLVTTSYTFNPSARVQVRVVDHYSTRLNCGTGFTRAFYQPQSIPFKSPSDPVHGDSLMSEISYSMVTLGLNDGQNVTCSGSSIDNSKRSYICSRYSLNRYWPSRRHALTSPDPC